jgi:WLM domain
MNSFIQLFIGFILIIILFMYYENFYSDLTYVEAFDGKQYLVRQRDDKQEAADLLANIATNCQKIVDYFNKQEPDSDRVQRLVKNFRQENISESMSNSDYTSYSINKGEKIIFCIRQKTPEQELIDLNTMMFVAIHELAHLMTKSIGHTEEFWENMKYILKHSIKIGVYKRQDFKSKPVEYCGTQITDTPLPHNES